MTLKIAHDPLHGGLFDEKRQHVAVSEHDETDALQIWPTLDAEVQCPTEL